jgi:hypothetical protein
MSHHSLSLMISSYNQLLYTITNMLSPISYHSFPWTRASTHYISLSNSLFPSKSLQLSHTYRSISSFSLSSHHSLSMTMPSTYNTLWTHSLCLCT